MTKPSAHPATPIHALEKKRYAAWLKKQSAFAKQWLATNQFQGDAGSVCLIPDENGGISDVVTGINESADLWSLAHLPAKLPVGRYRLAEDVKPELATQIALGWQLATYQFNRYKHIRKPFATLVPPKGCDQAYVKSMAQSIFWARDLINTPANDMHPAAMAQKATSWAHSVHGKVSVIKGDALLKANYPLIYHVGRASDVPPHLVDIRFHKRGAPKVTLVGKGVCFDSGGLDIKSTAGMKMMKKDMGGAACVLALARAIIETGLNVQLRVLLPIVENSISGSAMRPLDIVPSRKGIHVEIGNTDAEGRLILCDALTEADDEQPDLLIDCATLTGAARVALGPDLPAFFTSDEKLADEVQKHARRESDPMWRLPLWDGYRPLLESKNADLSNDPDSPYGGAITAALYLQEFVSRTPSWLHIDMMAWNLSNRPGRPAGGEAMAIRALYSLIKERYGS
jgi:leucyl aminopeptidase